MSQTLHTAGIALMWLSGPFIFATLISGCTFRGFPKGTELGKQYPDGFVGFWRLCPYLCLLPIAPITLGLLSLLVSRFV